MRPSPEEVEGSLWGRQDVKGHRQRQTLSEVRQVELGASKLPLHISIILGTGRQEAMPGPSWHGLLCSLRRHLFCLPPPTFLLSLFPPHRPPTFPFPFSFSSNSQSLLSAQSILQPTMPTHLLPSCVPTFIQCCKLPPPPPPPPPPRKGAESIRLGVAHTSSS